MDVNKIILIFIAPKKFKSFIICCHVEIINHVHDFNIKLFQIFPNLECITACGYLMAMHSNTETTAGTEFVAEMLLNRFAISGAANLSRVLFEFLKRNVHCSI